MDMGMYLGEIDHAARSVHRVIWEEHDRMEVLQRDLQKVQGQVREGYNRAAFLQANALDADDFMMGVGQYWETYFGDDKKLDELGSEEKVLIAQAAAHAFSRSALAASLLQFGKQGISLHHGGPKKCPDGRVVCAGQSLKTLIWQGRNQALHWEEGKPSDAVETCFQALAGQEPQFSDFKKKNMAFEAVNILGWHDFGQFQADMHSLA